MNRIIIIAGVPGAGKTTVLNEVYKQRIEKFEVISFGTEMLKLCKEKKLVDNRDQMRNLSHSLQHDLQIETAKKIASKDGNILLDTHCAIKTPGGYMTGLNEDMLEILKPQAIILVDAHEVEIAGRRKTDKIRITRTMEDYDEIKLHKKINRSFAVSFAQKSNALLKIVQNNTGEFNQCIEDIIQTLDYVLEIEKF